MKEEIQELRISTGPHLALEIYQLLVLSDYSLINSVGHTHEVTLDRITGSHTFRPKTVEEMDGIKIPVTVHYHGETYVRHICFQNGLAHGWMNIIASGEVSERLTTLEEFLISAHE